MRDQVLRELPFVVDTAAARLHLVDAAKAAAHPSLGKWSIQELVGHLLDSAVNNHHRFVRAQLVDELVFPRYEQNEWVTFQDYNHASWPDLVELWRLYNHHLAHIIRRIPEKKLQTRCLIGPSEPVTLEYLIEGYFKHLQHHLDQIDDILLRQ